MIDANPVWTQGTVLRYEPVQPHAMIVIEQSGADGQVHELQVEGPNLNRLERLHLAPDFLKPGDNIELCGFAFKEEFRANPPGTYAAGGLPALHAQILVLPDGSMQSWGPYGKFVNCVRPGDEPGAWVEFLNRDMLARDLWCRSRDYAQAVSTAPPEFIDEVGRRLTRPCD
jgi:hypothetical protein